MKLQKIFEDEYKTLKLKRVRLKSDPANNKYPYEGYVLHENEDGTIEMFVTTPEAPEPVMNVAPCDIDVTSSLSNLEKLKLMVAAVVKDDKVAEQIKNLNTVTDVESVLIANGYTFEDLYGIYKNFFLTSESFLEKLLGEAAPSRKPRPSPTPTAPTTPSPTPTAPPSPAPVPGEFKPAVKAPGPGVKGSVGGFLTKVGKAYQGLHQAADTYKELTAGKLGSLKDIGIKLLQKQLDFDTNKTSVMGTKGYQIVQYEPGTNWRSPITITSSYKPVGDLLEQYLSVYEAGPVDLRGGAIFGKHVNVIVVDKKTGILRMIKPDELPPGIKIPKPKPKPKPKPSSETPAADTPFKPSLLLKITKTENMARSGTAFTLSPANKESQDILLENGVGYGKFYQVGDISGQVDKDMKVLDNSGKIYFYSKDGKYLPNFTEDVSYFYTQTSNGMVYLMGPDIERKLTVMIDSLLLGAKSREASSSKP